MCLEEMLAAPPIPIAYLYYMEPRRREAVELDTGLRDEVVRMLDEMRQLYDRGYTPKVRPSAKCRACSLADVCLPRLSGLRPASAYVKDIWNGGDGNT